MVSFQLRKFFYAAAAGAQDVLAERQKERDKIEDLEKQIRLAKKIMNSIQESGKIDHAALIRAEGKLRKLELKLKEQKYRNGFA